MNEGKVIVVMSGGLDSTTLLYDSIKRDYTPFALSFNYGQRHSKELNYAKNTCRKLGVEHRTINLAVSGLTELIATSALTVHPGSSRSFDGDPIGVHDKVIDVPEGHYAEDNMKATVVPNRNMIMLSIAAGVAISQKAVGIATAVHAGDHFIYPDCRPSFINETRHAIKAGNEGFIHDDFDIMAPYIFKTKADIAFRALELNVPLHETWSCYKGGDRHCGKCGTCVERLEAIDEATARWQQEFGKHQVVIDLTTYEDKNYWREAVQKGVQ